MHVYGWTNPLQVEDERVKLQEGLQRFFALLQLQTMTTGKAPLSQSLLE
jgi:hypothetical protein